jgi:hypothetical protein
MRLEMGWTLVATSALHLLCYGHHNLLRVPRTLPAEHVY